MQAGTRRKLVADFLLLLVNGLSLRRTAVEPIFPPFLGKVLPIDRVGEGCVQTPFISPDVGKFGLFDNH